MIDKSQPSAMSLRQQQGSVLILMPVAVLVFIILGALAVDHAIAFMGERSLANASAAAANNAAAAGLNQGGFYGGTGADIDWAKASAIAQATIDAERLGGIENLAVSTTVVGDVVTVNITGQVNTIFSRAIPGGTNNFSIGATSTAIAEVPVETVPPLNQ
ncbi:MAG: hypothetical protein ACSLFB_13000 [Acidimicrobiales bacterium]